MKNYEIIILCSGIYGGNPHSNLSDWIEELDSEDINESIKFYMFVTWFGQGDSDKKTMGKINYKLNKINATLQNDYMSCYGEKMFFIRRGHPDEEDCKKVLEWVENL